MVHEKPYFFRKPESRLGLTVDNSKNVGERVLEKRPARARMKAGPVIEGLPPAAQLLVRFSRFSSIREGCEHRAGDLCTHPDSAGQSCSFNHCPKLGGTENG